MPITTVQRGILGKSMILKMDNGIDEKGNALYVSKTFSNVREGATDADVLNSANILAGLQNKGLSEVIVQDRSILLG